MIKWIKDNIGFMNIGIFILIISIVSGVLYWKYTQSTEYSLKRLQDANEDADQLIFEMEHQQDIQRVKRSQEYRQRMKRALEDD
jgi:CHASE3 domain sensor protein